MCKNLSELLSGEYVGNINLDIFQIIQFLFDISHGGSSFAGIKQLSFYLKSARIGYQDQAQKF